MTESHCASVLKERLSDEPRDSRSQQWKSPEPDWGAMHGNVDLQGLLKDQLRQELNLASANPESQSLRTQLSDFTQTVLSNRDMTVDSLNEYLTPIFDRLNKLYTQTDIPKALRQRQFINSSGLVMSPDYCIRTIKDGLRVAKFIRGIDAALAQLHQKKQKDGNPLRIAYPACGPFAPLLLPLLAYYRERGLYSESELSVSFVDIQPGASITLSALIRELSLESYTQMVACEDATTFKSESSFDLVILEAMQHGFSREGHLRIARHFASLLKPGGVFLPQHISVYASLVEAQQEFVDQWETENAEHRQHILDERISLGQVLDLDLNALRNLKTKRMDQFTELLECNQVTIPFNEKLQKEHTLIFNSRVNIFHDEWLEEYESGITHPLPERSICVNFTPKVSQPGDLLVKSGDAMQFFYCLNGLPGFLATKLENPVASKEDV